MPRKPSTTNERFVIAWQRHRNARLVGEELGLSRQSAYNLYHRLRRKGVRLAEPLRKYGTIDVEGLNRLIERGK